MSIWAKYAATVTKNDDDDLPGQGRIFVTCAELMGDETTEYPESIPVAHDWGWFYVPDIGEEIEIEVLLSDDQDEQGMVAAAAFTEQGEVRWRGVRFQSADSDGITSKSVPRPIDPLFTSKNYGKRRGFSTPQGHVFLFDDTEDDKQIILTWKKTKDGTDFTQMTMDKEGSILLLDYKSNMLHLNAKDGEEGITLVDKNSNMVSMKESGITVADHFSNIIELKDGVVAVSANGALDIQASTQCTVTAGDSKVDMKADGDVQVDCKNAKILATDSYELGEGADTELMRFKEWEIWAKAHMHATAFGPSGPPIVPPTPDIKSTIGTLKCSVWSVLCMLILFFWWLR